MTLPAQVDAILDDFRHWLTDLAAPVPTAGGAGSIAGFDDLFSLVAQFTALRQDVNMQTRASRAATEQIAEVMKFVSAPKPEPPAVVDPDEVQRPLLKALVDISDALSLALRQVERAQSTLTETLDQARIEPRPPEQGMLSRWFGRPPPSDAPAGHTATFERLRPLLAGVADGYALSLRRVERAFSQVGLEPIACVGHPFDPERMEAVELVDAAGQPGGTVVEEVRRGYLRNGMLFRFALVKVAR